ncbi:hypothetical protein BC828DRAFT_346492 [Blastocladiella britannica]|nr:hypothetical protein BC828DRAFT_346492 [Blastocladiella britannica]
MDVDGATETHSTPHTAATDVAPAVTAKTEPSSSTSTTTVLTYAKLDEEARKYLVSQTHEVIMPSYAAWFDMTAIHDIERQHLPEFFSGRAKSKSPAVYKEYRDFMINVYRLNPTEYLTVTAARRNLAGDVCAIMRVHAFLEQWGLINYHVDPDTRPAALAPPFTGHFRVTADTPRALQPYLPALPTAVAPGEASDRRPTLAQLKASTTTTTTLTATTTTTTHANLALRENCTTCGTDCTAVRYHATTADVDVCEGCYMDGRYASHLFAGDFVRLDHVTSRLSGASRMEWTDQETLLLLEGIEMYDRDWSAVAAHVGTRTREQCVAQFLALPIEDPYVGVPMKHLGPLQYHRAPFAEHESPVMSVLAFLAACVPPAVAKTVAKAATDAAARALDGTSQESGSTTAAPAAGPVVPGATALGLAAAQAAAQAKATENEMRSAVAELVDLQLRKVDLKLAAVDRTELALAAERRALEVEKQRVFLDKLALRRAQLEMAESAAVPPPLGPAALAVVPDMGADAMQVDVSEFTNVPAPSAAPVLHQL